MHIKVFELDPVEPSLDKVINAVNRQLSEDFGPVWTIDATLSRGGDPDAVLYVSKSDPGSNPGPRLLAYHSKVAAGLPYGMVFVEGDQPWTVAFSHEVLEMTVDPDVCLLVPGPDPNALDWRRPHKFVLRTYEICDPVQLDAYDIDGVAVSNFVIPKYFAPNRAGVQVDHLSSSGLESFGLRPGGYFEYFDPASGLWERRFADQAGRDERARKEKLYGEAARARQHGAKRELSPSKGALGFVAQASMLFPSNWWP